jgi:hypothetical protein
LRRANERRPTCDRARVDWVLAAWRAPEPEPLIKSGRGHVRDFLMARRTSRNAPRRTALAEQRGRRPAQRSRGAGRSRVCQNPARARPTGAPLGASKRARAVAVGRLDHIGTVEKKKPRRVGSVLRRAGVEGEGAGAYCEAGSHAVGRFAMTRRNPSALSDESLVYNNCSPGDTIIIAGTYLSLIARVCDFSRSVIATPGGNVLCVVSPQRPIRTNRR